MGLFSFMSRRHKGDGTTIESPIAVEDNEAAIAWLHRNYMKRGFIPSGGGDVPAAAGYSGIQVTLQNPKGETVKVGLVRKSDHHACLNSSKNQMIV